MQEWEQKKCQQENVFPNLLISVKQMDERVL